MLFKGKNRGRHSLMQHNIPHKSKYSKVHLRGATDPRLIAVSLTRTKCFSKKQSLSIVCVSKLKKGLEASRVVYLD